jgi:hypothetical protein
LPLFNPRRGDVEDDASSPKQRKLLNTDKKTIVLEALGDGKFSLSAQGIDKPVTIMADGGVRGAS